MTTALDDAGAERRVPERMQVPIHSEFADHYLTFVEHARAAGTNSAENVRALVTLANSDPDLRQRMQDLSQKLHAQRNVAANEARAAGMRLSRAHHRP